MRTNADYRLKEFMNAISAATEVNLTQESASSFLPVYNHLFTSAFSFIEHVLLRSDSNRRRLFVLKMDTEEAALLLTEHIMWHKLDYFLNHIRENGSEKALQMVNRMCVNRLKDLLRKKNDTLLPEESMLFLSSPENIEESYEDKAVCLELLYTLLQHANYLEVVSFLSTKVLQIKTGSLSRDLFQLAHGKNSLYSMQLYLKNLLMECGELFETGEVFGEYPFLREESVLSSLEDILRFDSATELAAHLSRCSDRAKSKVRKRM